MIERNDPCWCGSGKKWKKCHSPNQGPVSRDALAAQYFKKFGILIKTPEQIAGIRASCKLAAQILKELVAFAKEGVTTNQIDELSRKLHAQAGATPAPLGYGQPPFPKSVCTSKNEVICHGIPDDIPLVNGDIVNIDVTCILNGFYGDCSQTVCIGEVSEEKKLVVETSKECLDRAIAIVKPGIFISEIGKVIEDHAREMGCSVVNQFIGHGTGVKFHEPPQVPHHYNHLTIPMVAGMTFTIEPMINAGKREAIIDQVDAWTARTVDGLASAQFEHTILVTDEGAEVLTL